MQPTYATILSLPLYAPATVGTQIDELVPGDFFQWPAGSGGCQFLEIVKTFKNGKLRISFANRNGVHSETVLPTQRIKLY